MAYRVLRVFLRLVFSLTMRVKLHGAENLARHGGCLLACAHLSHLDPIFPSAALRSQIHWLARIEFFRRGSWSRILHVLGAIPINRFGVPLRAIKMSIVRARAGEVVGIFPEGEIKRGLQSVLRGGAIKKGVCLIAQRSGRPIVPCVILGTHKLLSVEPWLPFRRGRLWIAIGKPIQPHVGASGKKPAREEMARQVREAMIALFEDLKRRHALDDAVAP